MEVHDFPKKEISQVPDLDTDTDGTTAAIVPSHQEGGKVVPYGVYDPSANNGWVSVGSAMTQPNLRSMEFAFGTTEWGSHVILGLVDY